jgi:hypothetical protein
MKSVKEWLLLLQFDVEYPSESTKWIDTWGLEIGRHEGVT